MTPSLQAHISYAPDFNGVKTRYVPLNDTNGQRFKWQPMPVRYWIDANLPGPLADGCKKAMQMWSDASNGRVIFVPSIQRIQYPVGGGLIFSYMPGGWIGSEGILAFSDPLAATGTWLGAQIVFNGLAYKWHNGDPWWVPAVTTKPVALAQVDAMRVALHELGHSIIGLDHSADPSSVMSPTLTQHQNVLGADDIAGLRANYP